MNTKSERESEVAALPEQATAENAVQDAVCRFMEAHARMDRRIRQRRRYGSTTASHHQAEVGS